MRYTLENDYPQSVRYVSTDGKVVSNPSDALIDQLGAGYALTETPEPEYDPATQEIQTTYALADGVITQAHTVVDLPAPPEPSDDQARIAALEAELAELRAAIERGLAQ